MSEPRLDHRRICLVVATTTGGTGRHVQVLAAALVESGARVTVCGPADTDDRFGFSRLGAGFHPVPIGSAARPRIDQRTVRQLRALARGSHLVHAHSLRAGLLAGVATGRTTPFVVTLHNVPPTGGPKGLLAAAMERYVVRRADLILGVSPDLAARARRLGGRDVRPAPVSAPPLPPPTRSRADVRNELEARDRALIVAIGRLAEQKGFRWLVDAATLVADHPMHPLVVIAGEGPERGHLDEQIARSGAPVRLLGWRDDTADLLAAADVMVVPSDWEGSSLAVQEALCAGVPLVGTLAGGTPAMVRGGGLLVPPRDPEALATAIRTMLTSDEVRAAWSRAAANAASRLPTDRSVSQQVIRGYLDLWSRDGQRSRSSGRRAR